MWFRRDLRIADNPALNAAIEGARGDGDGVVVPAVLIDPGLWPTWGAPKQAYLIDSLRDLDEQLGGNLLLLHAGAREAIPALAREYGATAVHCAGDFTEYGIHRDNDVRASLETFGSSLEITGSGYAVAPGRVRKDDGTPYRVYTPFYRAWLRHGWRAPAELPAGTINWATPNTCHGYPERPDVSGIAVPRAGERAALERFEEFLNSAADSYNERRNSPDVDGTSKLSIALKWGEIHPRTLLARLDERPGHEVFRKEIAWREFYADVLFHNPHTIDGYYNATFANMRYDTGAEADRRFEAWCQGRTGYPFVDAGMRQLLTEGWMHNRVRMVVASFLVKDLHLEWQHGARFFFDKLLDGDHASNSHGWQWTAGCGTDASPYYRVFNPIGQGEKFDPNGDYVRRYVPELRHITDGAVHQPWTVLGGLDHGYPERIVDHAAERVDSLARLADLGQSKPPHPGSD